MPIRSSRKGPDRDDAMALALSALAFLAEDRTRLVRFLDLTGLSPAELGSGAQSPHVLGAVLDHLLEDESSLLMFAAGAGIAPETVAPARELLRHAGEA